MVKSWLHDFNATNNADERTGFSLDIQTFFHKLIQLFKMNNAVCQKLESQNKYHSERKSRKYLVMSKDAKLTTLTMKKNTNEFLFTFNFALENRLNN